MLTLRLVQIVALFSRKVYMLPLPENILEQTPQAESFFLTSWPTPPNSAPFPGTNLRLPCTVAHREKQVPPEQVSKRLWYPASSIRQFGPRPPVSHAVHRAGPMGEIF